MTGDPISVLHSALRTMKHQCHEGCAVCAAADAAMTQVEALVQAAQQVSSALDRGAGAWTAAGEIAMRDLAASEPALRSALRPFAAEKNGERT